MTARWRLQLLAEMGIGSIVRRQANEEDDKLARLRKYTHDRAV